MGRNNHEGREMKEICINKVQQMLVTAKEEMQASRSSDQIMNLCKEIVSLNRILKKLNNKE